MPKIILSVVKRVQIAPLCTSLSHGLDGFLTDVFSGLFSKSNNAPNKDEEEILCHS